MYSKKSKEQKDAESQRADKMAERGRLIYGMPQEFKEKVLDFERKFLAFYEENPVINAYELYLQFLGAVKNVEVMHTFTIVDQILYENIQTLWDGLGELRRRRKYAEEKQVVESSVAEESLI